MLAGERVVITGQVSPAPPAGRRTNEVRIFFNFPGSDRSNEVAGKVGLAPDGTFRLVHRPFENVTYFADALLLDDGQIPNSNQVAVFADYVPQIYWRHRSRGPDRGRDEAPR